MQNKQLERELKAIIHNLKADEINRITDTLEKQHSIFIHRNFTSIISNIQNRVSIAHVVL